MPSGRSWAGPSKMSPVGIVVIVLLGATWFSAQLTIVMTKMAQKNNLIKESEFFMAQCFKRCLLVEGLSTTTYRK
jgi:hypothetical protein